MAKSIKLGSDTYLDDSAVMMFSDDANFRGSLRNRIGVISEQTAYELSDMRLSAVGEFIKTHWLPFRWVSYRLNAISGATPGYFTTASLSVLCNLSSSRYGWAIIQSDNSNSIVFGTLSDGNWTWRHPTLTTVS